MASESEVTCVHDFSTNSFTIEVDALSIIIDDAAETRLFLESSEFSLQQFH
jgi:hypothetical protein